MLFMVIERFKNRDAKAIYSRFKESGIVIPERGVHIGWFASWEQ